MVKKKRAKRQVIISTTDNMSKKDRNNIKNGLRQAFARSAHRKDLMTAAKVTIQLWPTKGKKKGYHSTVRIKCVHCYLMYPENMIELDHIEEIGSFNGNWGDYIKRIWCDMLNLQTLCKWCHKVKTSDYNKEQQALVDLL